MDICTEQTGNKAPRVLIVDDNPEIREIIHILLGGEGYELEEAKNGDEALAKTEEDTFDLIILDIMMPGMDGYHTCMEIRKKSNAPILFLSAKTQEGDKMLGFSSGGDDYLAKPFSYNELVSRAKALIRRYQVYKGKQEPYYYGANNTVMVHMRNLRRKIEQEPKNPELIKTVWGRGYRCD